MATGLKAIDAMIPSAAASAELIIATGRRQDRRAAGYDHQQRQRTT